MGLSDDDYRECVDAHDDGLWKVVAEKHWAHPESTKLLFWRSGGRRHFVRAIRRMPNSRASQVGIWRFRRTQWKQLLEEAASGSSVKIAFVDESGTPVAIRDITEVYEGGNFGYGHPDVCLTPDPPRRIGADTNPL